MPVEIYEMVIRAKISSDQKEKKDKDNNPYEDCEKEDNIQQEIAEKAMEMLKRQKER